MEAYLDNAATTRVSEKAAEIAEKGKIMETLHQNI